MTANRIGYARVSTNDQDPQLQIDALTASGCRRVFVDTASGTKSDRPELAKCLDHLREGDTLTVWRLDRLGRSLPHLIATVEELNARGVDFASVTESIDTNSTGGRLVFNIFAALAQFERELIVERTKAGLASAKARGRVGGRPSVVDPAKIALARKRLDAGETAKDVAASIGVSRATLYRHI